MANIRGKYLQMLVDTFNARFSTPKGAVFGSDWFVDGYAGSDDLDGKSPGTAFATMTQAFTVVGSSDTIYLAGIIEEQITAPQDVFDVSIIGTPNRPRHSTASSVQQGSPADWRPETTATATPNLTLREQGWTIENILFDAPDAAACIKLARGEIAANMDASHATIRGCRFVGGGTGIQDAGGCFNVLIEKCVFQSLTNGIKNTSTAIAVPHGYIIRDNDFRQNTSDILMSLNYSTIDHNRFHMASSIVNTVYKSAQGDYNMVVENYFCDAAADIKTSATGGTNDVWFNYGTDAAFSAHA